ncbi:MAG: single-stranded-DNA-specific exonuclease RecJ [Planctomycetota bacterium]
MQAKRWNIAPPEGPPQEAAAEDLARALRLSPVCARLLVRRGYDNRGTAGQYLARGMDLLHEPHLLPDMAQAVARIAAAVEKGQKIVLFGDYDVDGLAATALLDRFFRVVKTGVRNGFQVESYVPDRAHGYGLSPEAAAAIGRRKPQLLITLDNGTNAHEHLAAFARAGIDCIVVDHHHVGADVPRAHAVINPKRRDGHSYPFAELCGAGLAFKLAWALAVHFSHHKRVTPEFRAFLLDAVALAGAGTLADVVPLVGENRVLAYQGLLALGRTRMPGLRALLQCCRVEGVPRAQEVTFRLAPRINAAGRCGDAAEALELLLTEDPQRAATLVAALDGYNTARQKIEDQILTEARAQALALLKELPGCRALVLHSPAWHHGVIGIVASRIVEEFYRPAVLLTVDGASQTARGSGRSVRGLHLAEALARTKEHLLEFGGHAAAAGLKLKTANIPAFRRAFHDTAASMLGAEEPAPVLNVDAPITLEQADGGLCSDLEKLEPCGAGNPRPLFAALNVAVTRAPRPLGREGKHFDFHVRQGATPRRVVAFNAQERFNELSDMCRTGALDIAFRPKLNAFRGATSVELMLEDFRPSG